MSTVVSRTFRSSPHRSAEETWRAIVDLLTQSCTGEARTELLAVSGIASSLIADRAPETAAMVVTCQGPRTRIHCLYDDDAIEGADASEDALGFDPLSGDWRMSLPCQKDDLTWVQAALQKKSTKITARDLETKPSADADQESEAGHELVLDPKGLFDP